MNSDTAVRNRRNLSPYNPQELARFHALLNEQKSDLLRSLEALSETACRSATGELSSLPSHLGDQASDTCEQNLSFDFMKRAQDELREIGEAIERIEWRSYGLCDDCGLQIPPPRLEAIPVARYCIDCKSRMER